MGIHLVHPVHHVRGGFIAEGFVQPARQPCCNGHLTASPQQVPSSMNIERVATTINRVRRGA
jgi:hypothetical protein